MIPTNVILDAIVDLLANDTGTLAPATSMHVHLAKANFTPAANLTVADFTEATFVGSTAAAAGTGPSQVFTDPVTQLRTIQLNEPAGGWTWICTAGTGLPEPIYGYYVTDTANTALYGSAKFSTPINITAAGQAVTVPAIRFTFQNGSPT